MSNVLLIEDDRYLSDDLQYFIGELGHRCVVYNGVDDVIENISKLKTFDVIILDLMMHRGKHFAGNESELSTGELLYEEIRNVAPRTTIIILTAKDRAEVREAVLADENVEFVGKPLVPTGKEVTDLL